MNGQFSWGDVLEVLVAIVLAGFIQALWEATKREYWRRRRLSAWEKRQQMLDEEDMRK